MKKILILLLTLLISIPLLSQENPNYLMYGCTKTTMISLPDNSKSLDKWNLEDKSTESYFLIRVDLTKSVIICYNSTHSKYFITNKIKKEKQLIDERYNLYSTTTYEAYDEEKKNCKFIVTVYDDINITCFTAKYENLEITWKCVLLENNKLK